MGGKQKVVMKVPVNDQKDRSRALKIAVGVQGCLSVAIEGADKIVVIGDNMDPVVLTKALRKKFGGADLITVAAVDDKKKDEKKPEEKKDEKKPADSKKDEKKPPEIIYCYAQPCYAQPFPADYHPDPCTIL